MKLGAKEAPATASNPAPANAPSDFNFGGPDTNTPPSNGTNDLPFEKQPFDAGVDADEESDPKKYIEQLTGKLGQSLRQYEDGQGQPDFELEKFAINSLLSATHTAEMQPEDQKDIIKKIKSSGKGDENAGTEPSDGSEDNTETSTDNPTPENDDDNLFEGKENNRFTQVLQKAKEIQTSAIPKGLAKAILMRYKNGDELDRQILNKLICFEDNATPEEFEEVLRTEWSNDDENCREALQYLDKTKASINKVATEMNGVEESFMLDNPKKNNMFQPHSNDILKGADIAIDEEKLENSEKRSIFVKSDTIKSKLKETFMQNIETEPITKPKVKPTTTPSKPAEPSRRNKPFLPKVTPGVQPDPKAIKEGKGKYEIYHKSFSSAVQTAEQYAESMGYQINDDEWFSTIATGPAKPAEGKTNRYSLQLYKDGKLQRKQLHIQVYGMANNYELNCYIA